MSLLRDNFECCRTESMEEAREDIEQLRKRFIGAFFHGFIIEHKVSVSTRMLQLPQIGIRMILVSGPAFPW